MLKIVSLSRDQTFGQRYYQQWQAAMRLQLLHLTKMMYMVLNWFMNQSQNTQIFNEQASWKMPRPL